MRKENSVIGNLFYDINKTKRNLNIPLSLNKRNLNVPLIHPICISARFVAMKTHFLMKSTRTMKTPLNASFTNTSFSFRSSVADVKRLLLKGGSVKVLSLMVVVMVCRGVVGQANTYSATQS